MKIAILILHYNTPELTEQLCQAIPEAIVIDNGSDVGKEYKGQNECIRFKINHGFTIGWNNAMKKFIDEYDFFWLMNSDIVISRESIEYIKGICREYSFGILTPSFNCWMKQCRNQGAGVRKVSLIEFTAPVISKKLIDEIGYFDERFKRGYGTEFDYCHRATEAGFSICVDDTSNFYHIGQQTINKHEGIDAYSKIANEEWVTGMSQKYGKDWQYLLFGDHDYINAINVNK